MSRAQLRGPQRVERYHHYQGALERLNQVKAARFGCYIVLGRDGIVLHIIDHRNLGWDRLPKVGS